jgi:fluoroquinolone transport system permease protein
MQFTKTLWQLGRNDSKLIGRDSFLVMILAYIIGLAIFLRFTVPWLTDYLAQNAEMPLVLSDLYPMFIAFASVFLGAIMAGMVFGFVLLDEKDDKTIKAMLVSPMPISQYMAYRVFVPAFLAFFIVLAEVYIINLDGTLLPFWQMALIALGASLSAPIATLFFAIAAENKVQGLAMTKFTGTAGMLILFSWFVAEPWQWLFGLFPPFWVSKAYWLALEGNGLWLTALAIGILSQVALIWGMLKAFNKVVYQ